MQGEGQRRPSRLRRLARAAAPRAILIHALPARRPRAPERGRPAANDDKEAVVQVTFERAGPADAEELVRIQIAAFHHDSVLYPEVALGGPPGYDSVEHMLGSIARHVCYKILLDGRPIGVLVIFDEGAGHAHLDVIAIDPAYHNRGVGTQAMRFFEQAHPAARYTLDTPGWAVRNQHFYEKLGYVRVGETAYPDLILLAYEKR